MRHVVWVKDFQLEKEFLWLVKLLSGPLVWSYQQYLLLDPYDVEIICTKNETNKVIRCGFGNFAYEYREID